MSVEEYAAHKGLTLTNPAPNLLLETKQRRAKEMGTTITKSELENESAELREVIEDIWAQIVDVTDESSNEDKDNALDAVAEILHDFDPESFPIDEPDEEKDAN